MLAKRSSALLLSAAETLPAPGRLVRAGRAAAELRGHELRHLHVGGTEVLSHAYVAVRDERWNTVPANVVRLAAEVRERSFETSVRCEHVENEIRLDWEGTILGTASGRVEFTMNATARYAFGYRRIGWCFLLPCEAYAGCRYRALGPGGELAGKLPIEIAPQLTEDGVEQPLFPAFSRLEIELALGLRVGFSFDGGLFEIEDQRNWTDATFKVYGTPLSLGGPFYAHPGQGFAQRVGLEIIGSGQRRAPRKGHTVLRVGSLMSMQMPAVGVGASHVPAPPTSASLLAELGAPHLRVELVIGDPRSAGELEAAAAAAKGTGAALEVALIVSDSSDRTLTSFAKMLRGLPVVRVFAFASGCPVTPHGLCGRLRGHLSDVGVLNADIVGGTNANFAELNRERPDLRDADAVSWSINPQVHSYDDESVIETLAIQAQSVACARALYPDLSATVSPITLRPRFNHDAGQFHEQAAGEDERRRSVDPRQSTLFCAAWTVGSLQRLALAGASSLTYFDAFGPHGLAPLGTEDGSVFPVFHVVAELARWRGMSLVELTAPPCIAAIGAGTDADRTVLVANLRAEDRMITVDLGAATARVRRLDLTTVEQAAARRAEFTHSWENLHGSSARIELGAYGVTWLKLTPRHRGEGA